MDKKPKLLCWTMVLTTTICLLFLLCSNTLFLDILVSESNNEYVFQVTQDNLMETPLPAYMKVLSESNGQTTMKRLYNMNVSFHKYDKEGALILIDGGIDFILQPITNPTTSYIIYNIPSISEINFSTRKIPDGIFRVMVKQKNTTYCTDTYYSLCDGLMSIYEGAKCSIQLETAEKNDGIFADLEVIKKGRDYFFYSVIGIENQDSFSQQVYLDISSNDSISKTYHMKPMTRVEYAFLRGSNYYIYSGASLLLPWETLQNGQYTLKLYLQQDSLYETPKTWNCIIAEEKIFITSN